MSFIDKILSRYGVSETKIKVFRNLYWAVLGKVVTLLGGLFVGILVARYLGPEQYGLMNYVISYVSLFQVFASFGMDNIEIREESKFPAEKNKIIGTAFFLKVFFAILTIGFVCLTAFVFESDDLTKKLIVLYSFSVIMSSFSVIRNYFTSIIWNEYIVKTEIVRTLFGALLKILLLFFKAPLVWFVVAILFDTILIAMGYLISYQKKIDSIFKWSFDKKIAVFLLKESFPLLLSGAAIVVYQKIDQIMIGNMIDKESVGYYAVAGAFVNIVGFIPIILSQTITPILVRAYRENVEIYREKSYLFMNVATWIVIVICIVICIISYPIIRYTYGLQYLVAVPILQITIFKEIGYAQAQFTGAMIISEGIQKLVALRNLIGCVISIILNVLLIPILGIMGAAISSVITAIFTGYLSHAIIPVYRGVFAVQSHSLLFGWKDIVNIKSLLKN